MDFDVHGGGDDLIFPHHENELAQSEAFAGTQPFVRIWMHNAMVQIDHEKMSKSLGNFVRLRELVRHHPAGALRLFVLSTHYRKPLQYSPQAVEEARRAWAAAGRAAGLPAAPPEAAARIEAVRLEPEPAAASAPQASPPDLEDVAARATAAFGAALADDLNTAGALGHLFDLVRAGNAALARGGDVSAALRALVSCGDILGLWEGMETASPAAGEGRAAGLVELLLGVRTEARAYRDWAMADRIRDGLGRLGVIVEDTPSGSRWQWADAEAPGPGVRA
jgi:cysteinyl-tRNA synthetase